MNEEQLEFPVVPGMRARRAKADPYDLEARLRGRHFCPGCGHDAAHAIVSNYHMCDRCNFNYGKTARAHFEQRSVKGSGLNRW